MFGFFQIHLEDMLSFARSCNVMPGRLSSSIPKPKKEEQPKWLTHHLKITVNL